MRDEVVVAMLVLVAMLELEDGHPYDHGSEVADEYCGEAVGGPPQFG